jgi:hypothetical protein
VTTGQDAPLPITLGGSDVDGHTLTFAIVSGPENTSQFRGVSITP